MVAPLDAQFISDDRVTTRYAEFTGLRNNITSERFGLTDMATASNVDIDYSGRVALRPGYTATAATGSHHSLWSDNSRCFSVLGSNLVEHSSTYVPTAIKALSAPLLRMSFSKVNDQIYFSNGVDNGVIAGGSTRTWGLRVPAPVGVTVTAGDMPAGTYQFTVTHSRSDGQESGSALAGSLTVPLGSALVFDVPASSDPSVVTKTVYLSTPNGDTMFAAVFLPNATTTTTYSGDTTELSEPLETQFLGPPPAGQLTCYYRGQLFVAVDDVLYPSEPYAYELFDYRKYMPMDGRITMLASIENNDDNSGLFVGTDRNCGVLIGSTDFRYVKKTEYGVIEGSLAYVDGSVFGDGSSNTGELPIWMSAKGLCVGLPQMEVKNLTHSRYNVEAGGRGAACFIPETNKFIATFNL